MIAWVVIPRRPPRQAILRASALFAPLLPFPHLSPLLPFVSALFCRFLHCSKTQSSSFHAFPHSFTKTKVRHISSNHFSPDPEVTRIRISQIEDQNGTANCYSSRDLHS